MKTCFLSMADIFLQNPSDCKIHCYNQDFSPLSVCHTSCGCTRLPGLLLDIFLLLLLSLWTDLLRTWLPTTYSLCTTPPAFFNSVTTLISLAPHTPKAQPLNDESSQKAPAKRGKNNQACFELLNKSWANYQKVFRAAKQSDFYRPGVSIRAINAAIISS